MVNLEETKYHVDFGEYYVRMTDKQMLGKLLSHRYTRIKSINFYVILVFSAFFILYLMRDSIVVVPYKIWQ